MHKTVDIVDITYGAMMILAPGIGSGPKPSISLGTWASHWSSWRERVGPWAEYHDPEWVASLEDMLGSVLLYPCRVWELLKLKWKWRRRWRFWNLRWVGFVV
jgi:hypothetical protein